MKITGVGLCLAVVCSAGLLARTEQSETKSQIKVKDGKSVTVTGCVEPTASGTGFMLTHVADKTGELHSYMLVLDDGDLRKHVGQRVQLSGKVTDRGDAKVEVETKTKTKREGGGDKETQSKSEMKGDLPGMPFLGVREMKMIAAVCP